MRGTSRKRKEEQRQKKKAAVSRLYGQTMYSGQEAWDNRDTHFKFPTCWIAHAKTERHVIAMADCDHRQSKRTGGWSAGEEAYVVESQSQCQNDDQNSVADSSVEIGRRKRPIERNNGARKRAERNPMAGTTRTRRKEGTRKHK
jgi:hypothetical protein